MGINGKIFNNLRDMGVDVVTMGNHTWGKKDIFNIIEDTRLLVPANYPKGAPGNGYGIYEAAGKMIAVVSLIGRVDMGVLSENPFLKAEEIISEVKDKTDIIIVDFHAEATAEKIAMGYFLDGKITCLFGTHTHIQTADEQILDKGTAYITDIGMTGPKRSVIGMDIDASIKRFVTTLPERYRVSSDKEVILCGCILEIDNETHAATALTRIRM